ncbi:hypothetical protein IMZ08_05555 [Bacillus luteolus]|uniref:Uncharacterized protein n=1 Tax=Litchfieldia luteola TaxID=682179 RepID=A0ABR9QH08_9BACI|nr:hypothetical protein [Cytobacillus luteolus]MBE4907529.1 hypothetical protein [Cytobacillus luteolus]MBP1944298.1 hypothetical protein [Cytobacillus luteolus]
MMVIATFENSIYIELAITALEQKGIPKERIFAAPLDKRQEPRQIFDTIHQADGISLFDAGAILGTCLMLLGAIYGQILEWGPIIWGIIGAVVGIVLGISIKLFIFRKKQFSRKKIVSEVVLMIRCDAHQWDLVEKILWENTAIGLTKVK